MSKVPDRKPLVIDAASLNKYLLGQITRVKREELSIQEALATAKMAEAIIKLNTARLLNKKMNNGNNGIEFFNCDNSNLDAKIE